VVEDRSGTVTISVVIPAYNSARYIRETLESVLAQTYPPLEIIVVDDGSTDETSAIVQSFASRVRLLQQEHQGVSEARNFGIQQAKGDYIAFIDSDDLWLPEKLALQAACIIEKQVVWVSCFADYLNDSDGRILYNYRRKLYEGDVLEKLFLKTFIRSPTPLVKRTVFEEVGYFNEDFETRATEDTDMWLRIAAIYPLGVVRQVLAFVRLHPASTTSRQSVDEKMRSKLLRVDQAVARQPQRLARYKNRALARIYLSSGTTLLKQGEYERARLLIDKARSLNPYRLETQAHWLILHTGEIGKGGYRLFRKMRIRAK
jgi:glycosyltransferase involved in cell wall biosynthesis